MNRNIATPTPSKVNVARTGLRDRLLKAKKRNFIGSPRELRAVDEHALVHVQHARRAFGHLWVVGDDDERLVELAAQRGDEFHHGFSIFAVEIASGFVGQHERRISYDGPCDSHTLFLPAAQLPGQMVFAVRESHDLKGGHDLLVTAATVEREKQQRQFDVLVGSKNRHQIEGLEDVTDIACAPGRKLVFTHFRDVAPVHDHFAPCRRIHPGHEIKQCGLATAARPHQAKELAGSDLDSHALKHIELLAATGIDFVNVANFNNRVHGAVTVLSAAVVAASFSRKVTLTLMSGRRLGDVSLRRIFA